MDRSKERGYRADGGITRLNATARALLGYGPALEGESLAALARRLRVERADGSPCPAAELPAARALLGEVVRGVMLAFHPPAGDPVWVAVSAGPILAADGALRGAVATLTDITPLRRLQEQRDDFVHMVSHDLRSPLTGVLLQAELLGRRAAERGDGPSSQGLQSIIRNAHQMAAMIGDLVDSTRLESGQLPLELAPLALGPFLSEVMRHLGGADVARIRVAAPAELPAARGDGRQLERVVTNLITNAVKYSPPGSPIVVTAEAVSGELRVSIADAGPGIPAEDQPHLFARYYRARQTTRTEGLGLGLYITRLLVEAHGGRIWVESAPGRGSTFRFTLPTAG